MRPSLCSSLFLAALSFSSLQAQEPAAAAPAPELRPTPPRLALKDGDTWVFLGDSITHQCLYTQYVEDYVYTRYPRLHIHFHNAGVGGDRAQDALDRFEGDVAAQKPNYVTILLGMNDGAYRPFQQEIFDEYQKGMTTLLEKLAAINAAAIPMTPTMFDARADALTNHPNALKETYYNGVLALYGSWLREQALGRGLDFVDMWSPLNNLAHDQRRTDARWTQISDAVHPGHNGQVVMAAAVIDDILEHTPVSRVTVGQENGQWAAAGEHGAAANLQKTEGGVSFDFTAEALPWVLPPEAEGGYQLTHAGPRFSAETLAVRDLASGKYDLQIDGQVVGTYSSGDLAAGVELEANAKTPEYQQALKVALLNRQRNDEVLHPLRDQWGSLKGRRNALARAEAAKAPDLEVQRVAFREQMAPFEAAVGALLARSRQFEEQIYQANQPMAHHYELVAAK